MNPMRREWERLEHWLSANWPDGLADLNPPATDEEIADLQTQLGVTLPPDVIEFLKVHNGQGNRAGGLLDNSEFLSTHAIVDQWKVWKGLLDSGDFNGITSNPEKGIRSDWWNPKWIPITHNGGGDHYCIDLAPADGGVVGQVITMWHDMPEREIQARSMSVWFEKYVSAVLDGQSSTPKISAGS